MLEKRILEGKALKAKHKKLNEAIHCCEKETFKKDAQQNLLISILYPEKE